VSRHRSRLPTTALSVADPPLLFALFTHLSYRYALAHGEPPFSLFGELRFWPVLWLLVIAGVAGLAHGLARRPALRLAACTVYAVFMPIALFVVGLVVVCWNGDCF
jgi:hypothetical protein